MKNQDLNISIKTVWLLIIGNLLLATTGAIAKILHWNFSDTILIMAFMLFFSSWVIVLSDMVKRRFSNKFFWVTSRFVLPAIAPIFYLIQRRKLLKY